MDHSLKGPRPYIGGPLDGQITEDGRWPIYRDDEGRPTLTKSGDAALRGARRSNRRPVYQRDVRGRNYTWMQPQP